MRWEWTTLPAFVVLATMLLSAVVMMRTASGGVGSWKDGPLTLLLFDVDEVIEHTSVERLDGGSGSATELKLLEKQKVTLGKANSVRRGS